MGFVVVRFRLQHTLVGEPVELFEGAERVVVHMCGYSVHVIQTLRLFVYPPPACLWVKLRIALATASACSAVQVAVIPVQDFMKSPTAKSTITPQGLIARSVVGM
jgi:hypothetical protein